MFLRNAWYVAAWSDEIGRQLLGRTICEQPMLLYRMENGNPAAIGNMCPHRFAPLDRGKLIGDVVQCGYHGLRFGEDGRCVLNPHADKKVPGKMRVPNYPVVERYDMIWVWMGEPELADPTAIPDYSFNVAPGFRRIGGMIEIQANYELISDNVLDLTHAEFVHEGLLSSEAMTISKLETLQVGTTIWSNRWCPNGEAPPAWKWAWGEGADQPFDQWGYTRWDPPANMTLDVGMSPVGRPRGEGIWLYGTDCITPKDSKSCYYFWAFARNYRIDDPSVDEFWTESIKVAFEGQDKPIIEAQQAMMGDRTLEELGPVLIAADAASTRARRILRKLIEEEEHGEIARSHAEAPLELLQRRKESRTPVEPVV